MYKAPKKCEDPQFQICVLLRLPISVSSLRELFSLELKAKS